MDQRYVGASGQYYLVVWRLPEQEGRADSFGYRWARSGDGRGRVRARYAKVALTLEAMKAASKGSEAPPSDIDLRPHDVLLGEGVFRHPPSWVVLSVEGQGFAYLQNPWSVRDTASLVVVGEGERARVRLSASDLLYSAEDRESVLQGYLTEMSPRAIWFDEDRAELVVVSVYHQIRIVDFRVGSVRVGTEDCVVRSLAGGTSELRTTALRLATVLGIQTVASRAREIFSDLESPDWDRLYAALILAKEGDMRGQGFVLQCARAGQDGSGDLRHYALLHFGDVFGDRAVAMLEAAWGSESRDCPNYFVALARTGIRGLPSLRRALEPRHAPKLASMGLMVPELHEADTILIRVLLERNHDRLSRLLETEINAWPVVASMLRLLAEEDLGQLATQDLLSYFTRVRCRNAVPLLRNRLQNKVLSPEDLAAIRRALDFQQSG